MKEIVLPSDLPLTLVTTAVCCTDLLRPDRFLLDLHSPKEDLRLHFTDAFFLRPCRRALTAMLHDARRLSLHPDDGVVSRLYTLHENAYAQWSITGRL